MKYQYKGDTTYRNLEIGQTVIFVYSNAELTKKANLYSENGITLYASGQSTVNLTNIDILYTTSANDIIPTSVKDSDKRLSGNNYTYERTVVGIGEESVEVKALKAHLGDVAGGHAQGVEGFRRVKIQHIPEILILKGSGRVKAAANHEHISNAVFQGLAV